MDMDFLSGFHQVGDDFSSERSSSEMRSWHQTEQPARDWSTSVGDIPEPTPIAKSGIVIVERVPVKSAPWKADRAFLASLRYLLQESFSTATSDVLATQMTALNRASSESATSIGVVSLDDTFVDYEEEGGPDALSSSSSSFRSDHVEQWNQRYRELVNYQAEYGHCLVPLNWQANPSLAHWVKRQRYQFRMKEEGKHSTMTECRQAALESLGFVWDSQAAQWEERWNELGEFKERHGHCNVPKKYPRNQQLAVWVKCQRRQYKLFGMGRNSNMTRRRIEKLQFLGFVFDPRAGKRSTAD